MASVPPLPAALAPYRPSDAAALLFRSPSSSPGVSPASATRRRRFPVVASAREMPWPHVLTVAGSDSGAGAGIQADIKGVHAVPEEFVGEQLRSVLSDMSVDVVKTGMLLHLELLKFSVRVLGSFQSKAALVVDPVMVSTSGDTLSGPSTLATYRDELFSMADIVTPNVREASKLLGDVSLHTISDMRNAAESIYKLGPKYVLVKGGDMPDSSDAIDVLFDGKEFTELRGLRIKTRNTHGTGCTLASCIAAELAKGATMLHAVQVAKKFVESALYHSKDLVIGNGP
ncbi:unnamed protein product [Miscanthus lutarioriparius]|uniref:Pyridoxamine kinase/Phosphomethylpyrimidine kinase domain-containing protein n=1 Tax=Miscanthus lutarioriparius TaxID=422564 RepID=A0A811RJV5_9POAL|nr:unnamed protein product [Miscanthus lutarioriparius]